MPMKHTPHSTSSMDKAMMRALNFGTWYEKCGLRMCTVP